VAAAAAAASAAAEERLAAAASRVQALEQELADVQAEASRVQSLLEQQLAAATPSSCCSTSTAVMPKGSQVGMIVLHEQAAFCCTVWEKQKAGSGLPLE
jgi:hypothetical protein